MFCNNFFQHSQELKFPAILDSFLVKDGTEMVDQVTGIVKENVKEG